MAIRKLFLAGFIFYSVNSFGLGNSGKVEGCERLIRAIDVKNSILKDSILPALVDSGFKIRQLYIVKEFELISKGKTEMGTIEFEIQPEKPVRMYLIDPKLSSWTTYTCTATFNFEILDVQSLTSTIQKIAKATATVTDNGFGKSVDQRDACDKAARQALQGLSCIDVGNKSSNGPDLKSGPQIGGTTR